MQQVLICHGNQNTMACISINGKMKSVPEWCSVDRLSMLHFLDKNSQASMNFFQKSLQLPGRMFAQQITVSFLAFSCEVALSSCLDFTIHIRLLNIHSFYWRAYLLVLQRFRIYRFTRTATAMRYLRLLLQQAQHFATPEIFILNQ